MQGCNVAVYAMDTCIDRGREGIVPCPSTVVFCNPRCKSLTRASAHQPGGLDMHVQSTVCTAATPRPARLSPDADAANDVTTDAPAAYVGSRAPSYRHTSRRVFKVPAGRFYCFELIQTSLQRKEVQCMGSKQSQGNAKPSYACQIN
jgi:hypothetical protein